MKASRFFYKKKIFNYFKMILIRSNYLKYKVKEVRFLSYERFLLKFYAPSSPIGLLKFFYKKVNIINHFFK